MNAATSTLPIVAQSLAVYVPARTVRQEHARKRSRFPYGRFVVTPGMIHGSGFACVEPPRSQCEVRR